MHKVAETLCGAECAIGLDSVLVNMHDTSEEALANLAQCDLFVPHTHFPNELKKRLTKPLRMVFIGHGTPEYIFQTSVQDSQRGYGHGDGFMLWMHWMKIADAVVTFWPRHQAVMRSMCDKNTPVHLVPLGIDKAFWEAGQSKGRFAGTPSVMSCENSHFIKWAYDLIIAWPWIYERIPDACLHLNYLPTDQHRWFFPLLNRNGASYGAHVSPLTFEQGELRNILKSIDFYANLVRYGDFNRIGMEAAVCGAKVISYYGNPYAHYWIREGSQIDMAAEMTAILSGQRRARTIEAIPEATEMAGAMKSVYEQVLNRPPSPFFSGYTRSAREIEIIADAAR